MGYASDATDAITSLVAVINGSESEVSTGMLRDKLCYAEEFRSLRLFLSGAGITITPYNSISVEVSGEGIHVVDTNAQLTLFNMALGEVEDVDDKEGILGYIYDNRWDDVLEGQGNLFDQIDDDYDPEHIDEPVPARVAYTDEQLIAMAVAENIDWVPCDHPVVNRMRLILALRAANVIG